MRAADMQARGWIGKNVEGYDSVVANTVNPRAAMENQRTTGFPFDPVGHYAGRTGQLFCEYIRELGHAAQRAKMSLPLQSIGFRVVHCISSRLIMNRPCKEPF